MGKIEGQNGNQQEEKKLSREEQLKLKHSVKRKKQKDKKKLLIKQLPGQIQALYLEQLPMKILDASEEEDEQTMVEEIIEDQPKKPDLDPDTLLTGKDYDNFRSIFESFNNHRERLVIKTYENIDPEKEKERELKEQEAEQKRLQQQQQQALMVQNPQLYLYQQRMGLLPSQQSKQQKLSKKQRKQLRWLKVAELKQLVKRPDLVEFWDITSTDPLFLVHLKSQRNTVSIPRHWSQKRKYLQNKRGVLKEFFKLPEYIENTGIARLRDPFVDRDGGKMVKQKLRERMNPKQGKLDIDYQVLHDAFFKHQTRPLLTRHGDIYFEGKEEEMRARTFKPGRMSSDLRAACGLTDFQAPPWLPNMQRYGPPPSYPYMKFIGMTQIFSEASTYHTSVKQIIEDTAKKMDQAGLYATFKYMDDDDLNEISALADLREDMNFDKSLWGIVEEIEEEELPAEEAVQV